MGKTRDLSKKIKATKGKFHGHFRHSIMPKNGHDKGQNGKELTEAEEIRGGKNSQKYT